ncbi:MAG: ATP-dependent Clp protease adapter ClpS [Desulfatibacillaceae bacterium]
MCPRNPDNDQQVREQSTTKTKKPSLYRVLLHNDDYTTMDFVVWILQTVFHKGLAESTRIMWRVHKAGVGVCGLYTYEVAETKVGAVHELARKEGFPLKCSMEPE